MKKIILFLVLVVTSGFAQNSAIGSLGLPYGIDTGAQDTVAIGAPAFYNGNSAPQADGTVYWFLPNHNNVSATPTITVGAFATLTIVKRAGAALIAGDYTTSAVAECVVHGSNCELQNPQTGNSTGSTGQIFTFTGTNQGSGNANFTVSGGALTVGINNSVTGSEVFETASNTNAWTLGINGAAGFQFTTTATSQSTYGVTFPGQVAIAANGGLGGFLALSEGTSAGLGAVASVDILIADSTTHLIKMTNGLSTQRYLVEATATDTTTTDVLFATAVAGVYTAGAISSAALPVALSSQTSINGITIASTYAAHNLLLGEGTSAFGTVSCGAGTTLLGNAADPTCSAALVLGVDNSTAGTVQTASSASLFHTIWGSPATMTATNTILGPTAVIANGHAVTCTTVGTVCTLTDGGAPGVGTVTSSSSAQYQIAVFSTASNIQGITFGAGTTLQGSATNPTATATPTFGVQATTAGALTLAGTSGTSGTLTLNGSTSGTCALTVTATLGTLELCGTNAEVTSSGGIVLASSIQGTALTLTALSGQIVTGATNTTTLTFPAPGSSVTLTFPITSLYMIGAASDTTVTHVLHATAVAGVGAFSAIATGDLPTIPIAGGGLNATSAAAGQIPVTSSSSASAWSYTPTLGDSTHAGGLTISDGGSITWNGSSSGSAAISASSTGVLALPSGTTVTNLSATTPTLGVASATSINKVTITAPATGSTLTIIDGKTLTATNTMDVAKTAGVVGSIPYYDTTTSMSATATPTLGVAGSSTGTLTLASSTATGSITLTPASSASAFTVTIPGATDTLVNLAGTQTLTNKTLTAPVVTTQLIDCHTSCTSGSALTAAQLSNGVVSNCSISACQTATAAVTMTGPAPAAGMTFVLILGAATTTGSWTYNSTGANVYLDGGAAMTNIGFGASAAIGSSISCFSFPNGSAYILKCTTLAGTSTSS